MKIIRKLENKLFSIIQRTQIENRKGLFKKLIKSEIMEYREYTYREPLIQYDRYSQSKIIMGKFCYIAHNVTIFNGSNHNTDWVFAYPF